jgi:MoxR-like ATPase
MANNVLELINRVSHGMDEIVLFRQEVKHLLLIALISRGHVLIEGLPGTAKTLISRTFARLIGGEFKRVQGTPDMLPADILGFYLYRPDGSTFMPGPIFANVVMVDELNRLSPRTQSALLEAMQEYQVTIEGHTYPLEQPFMVIASQLPYGGAGTTALSDVQADRFMLRAWHGYPDVEEEDAILTNIDRISHMEVNPIITTADILTLQETVLQVHIDDAIRRYVIDLVNCIRQHRDILIGPSVRGSLALYRGARAHAMLTGRDYVIPDDVKRLAQAVLYHRIHLKAEAESENISSQGIIRETLEQVPVPRV